MRIIAIGDPHGNLAGLKKVPLKGADAIIMTGDIGSSDLARKMAFERIEKKGVETAEPSKPEMKQSYMEIYHSSKKVMQYLASKAPTYSISGNIEFNRWRVKRFYGQHGISIPVQSDSINAIKGAELVNNRVRRICGLRIGFLEYFIDTCWVKEFRPMDYKGRMKLAKKETDKARRVLRWFGNIDILVCHQPPYGILDKVTAEYAPKQWKGKHAGSKAILDYIKKRQPKLVLCGHIHEQEGKKKIGKTQVHNLGMLGHLTIDTVNSNLVR